MAKIYILHPTPSTVAHIEARTGYKNVIVEEIRHGEMKRFVRLFTRKEYMVIMMGFYE